MLIYNEQIAIPRNYNITLQLVFVPEVPSSRVDGFVDQDAIFQQWNKFALKRFSITLDRLCTMKTLKQQIKQEQKIPEEFLILSEGNMILMEASSQGFNKGQQTSSSPETEAELHRPVSLKFLSDTALISAVGPQNVVYIYTPNVSNQLLSFVHLVSCPYRSCLEDLIAYLLPFVIFTADIAIFRPRKSQQ